MREFWVDSGTTEMAGLELRRGQTSFSSGSLRGDWMVRRAAVCEATRGAFTFFRLVVHLGRLCSILCLILSRSEQLLLRLIRGVCAWMCGVVDPGTRSTTWLLSGLNHSLSSKFLGRCF